MGEIYAFVVNDEGYVVDAVVVAEGEKTKYEVTTPFPDHILYKPKWTGSEWVEGASETEIDEMIKSRLPIPSDKRF